MPIWNPFSRKEDLPANSSEPIEPAQPSILASEERESLPASSEPNVPATEPESRPGVWSLFRKSLAKTYQVLNTDIRDLVGKEGRIVDEAFIEELYGRLIKTDMGNGPARAICDAIYSKFRARKLEMHDLLESAKSTVRQIMQQEPGELKMAERGPTVIMVCGVNGSGKTTSIAKLAYRFTHQGKSVVLGAGDTFRAAAVEQLTIWAKRMDAEIVTGKPGSDPASVAYRAVEAAVNNQRDVCIIDTAGRLQTQANLMDELSKIRRVMGRVIPDAPHEVLLVLDATAGQNAISQARGFSQAAGCTGIILAKLDGTAKGGVAIPIRQEFGLPVKFVGLGETPDAFAEFDVDRYVDTLLEERG
jgi:fused signal recognition particle receptor